MSGILLACVAATGGAAGTTPSIALSDQYISESVAFGSTSQAGIQLTDAGLTNGVLVLFNYPLDPWCVPGASSSLYEAYVTLLAGTLDGASAATGTWLSLGTTRLWTGPVNGAPGPAPVIDTVSINIAIRAIGTTEILASGNIELVAAVGVFV